ncbi:unnamed protein product [Rotaria sordida]|uniref:CCHC-type domain-containing protein n=1 Tax=Rotaria sordida TaxID=392033 RepID=A0A815JXJ8_9BILA|nr:unnamed protein product [Rotaria sordida]
MAGIKDSLKTHVALQDPKTSEAFMLSARKIEDLRDQANSTPTSNNKFTQKNPRYADATQTRTTSNKNTTAGNNANRQDKFSNSTRSTQKLGVCYNCGTPDHYARDCTRPHFQ